MAEFQGLFVWYDLMTSDVDAAVQFYRPVVGWETQTWEGEMPYEMWTAGGEPMGGVMALPEETLQQGAPPHWMGYVGVSDVSSTINQALNLGGVVLVPPMPIPQVGTFAVIKDPQGGVVAVFTPESEPPALPGGGQPGQVAWHELMTTDLEGAWDFYSALFGWRKTEAMDMGEHGVYQMYAKGERTLGGMVNKPAAVPGPPQWLYYFTVADLDRAVETVNSHGGQVINGPMEVPGGDRVAHCVDPQGALFALLAVGA